jgi:hypothetical protein
MSRIDSLIKEELANPELNDKERFQLFDMMIMTLLGNHLFYQACVDRDFDGGMILDHFRKHMDKVHQKFHQDSAEIVRRMLTNGMN